MHKTSSMKKSLFLLIPVFLLLNCTKPVNIDIEDEPLVVIQGFLFDGQTAQVRISRSFNILSTEMYNYDNEFGGENIDTNIVFLRNAEVKWYEDGQFVENMNYLKNGYFAGQHTVAQGHTYRVEVKAAGFPTASGTALIPVPVQLDSMELAFMTSLDYQHFYKGKFYFQVPPGKHFLAFSISGLSFSADPDGNIDTIESRYRIGQRIEEQSLNSDHPMDGGFYIEYETDTPQHIVLDFILTEYGETLNSGDTAMLSALVKNVPEDYIKLRTSLQNYDENGGGFGNPFNSPVQIYNNIDGGLGIFTGLSADTLLFPFVFINQNH